MQSPTSPQNSLHSEVLPLGQVLRSLEDSGEVNLGLAEHDVSKSGNELGFQVKHDVCFVLDPLNAKKRKKATTNIPRMFNFSWWAHSETL